MVVIKSPFIDEHCNNVPVAIWPFIADSTKQHLNDFIFSCFIDGNWDRGVGLY
jgi:hypothetical protein